MLRALKIVKNQVSLKFHLILTLSTRLLGDSLWCCRDPPCDGCTSDERSSFDHVRKMSAPSFWASIRAGVSPLRSRNDCLRMAPRAENGLSPVVAPCCGDSNFFLFLLCRLESRTPNASRFRRASVCTSCWIVCLVCGSSHRSIGVSPFLVFAWMSPPYWQSSSIRSGWAQQAAAWIGCQKSLSRINGDTEHVSRNAATS